METGYGCTCIYTMEPTTLGLQYATVLCYILLMDKVIIYVYTYTFILWSMHIHVHVVCMMD